MINAFLTLAYAVLIFALAGEAQTPWLRVVGVVAAVFMTLIGCAAGWMAARE